jgi:hypothetical protein
MVYYAFKIALAPPSQPTGRFCAYIQNSLEMISYVWSVRINANLTYKHVQSAPYLSYPTRSSDTIILNSRCQSCLVGLGGFRLLLVRFLVCVLYITFDLVLVLRQGLFSREPTEPGRGFPPLWIWAHVPPVSRGMGQV